MVVNPAGRHGLRRAILLALAGAAVLPAAGQGMDAGRAYMSDDPSSNFAIQNPGAVPYRPSPSSASRRAPYNVRMGPVSARFSAGTSVSYTDNAIFTDQALGRADDFVVTPMFTTALEWPITEMNGLRIDVGVGYQKHLIQDQLDTLTVSPNSTIDWMIILGDVRISFFNRTSTPGDLLQRPELVATGSGESAAFRRIQNQAGLSAAWLLTKDVSLQSGYSYDIERGLAGNFDTQDRDTQNVTAALYRRLNPVWTVGLSGSGALQTYSTRFQNDSTSYSGGVLGTWQPSRYFNASANVRYAVTAFDKTGRISDTSDFAGITYDLQITHRFLRNWSYVLSGGKGANSGYGNNFTEQLTGHLGLIWSGIENLGVQFDASYVNAKESGTVITLPRSNFAIGPGAFQPSVPGMVDDGFGQLFYFPPGSVDRGNGAVDLPLPGQSSDLYQVGVTVSHRFGERLTASLGYNYNMRTSDLKLRNYAQNTVTLSLSYQF